MSDQKYSCQGCERTDLTLTRNGKVRSHAPNGKRVGQDNPACGFGSMYPLESTQFHTHLFEYGDDNHGHSGSFCECGLEEPDGPPAAQPLPGEGEAAFTAYVEESGDVAPVPPNPFRDPLPGGVFDSLPHDRQLGDAGVSQRITQAPRSADDFLDGSDDDYAEDAEDRAPSYFSSRYDGSCVTCGEHFLAGENIRRNPEGGSGYEAQGCCGEGAQSRPERPKSVARTLPVVRGRYKLPHPVTGEPVSASRSSKFAEGIADSFALDQWRHRMILVGVLNDPEILDKVMSGIRDLDPLDAVKVRREFLNKRAEDAMTAAGGDIRSGAGTTLHKYTEEVDAGTRALADVPEEYRRDAAAYVRALNNCGFRPVKGLIERSVYCDEMKVCGTFDRVLECIWTTDVLDLDGRETTIRRGEFVIGDVKGLALTEKIPTPDGWTTMGDVRAGDTVFDAYGKPCKVMYKSPVKRIGTYVVTFDDGSHVVCDTEHIWWTSSGFRPGMPTAKSISEVIDTLRGPNGAHHRVPVAGSLDLPEADLPIDPYLLGCWLGDGHVRDGSISKGRDLFEVLGSDGHTFGVEQTYPLSDKCVTRTVEGLSRDLRVAGLLHNKHIPDAYLRSSIEQRTRLLQGLMDTDGSWNVARHRATFNTTDKSMAYQVEELMLSLGQRPYVAYLKRKGFGLTVDSWTVEITPVDLNPFRLPRKADQAAASVKPVTRSRRRVITEVLPGPDVETACIAVDSSTRTYLCGDRMIPTHNSGDNIKHPWLEILIQEALYAHAANENGVAVQDEPGGPFRWAPLPDFGVPKVREDVGVVMHIPYGSGECKFYAADLITGWRGAKICKDNRDFWKIELPKVPIATYAVTDEEDHAPGPDDQEFGEEPVIGSEVDYEDGSEPPAAPDPETAGAYEEFGVRCACGQAWDNIETANAYDHDTDACGPGQDPSPPKNIMEAVKRAKDEARESVRLGFTPPTAATVKMPPVGMSKDQWTEKFRAARTREEANALWRKAKDAGVDAMDLRIMVSLVTLDPKAQKPVPEPEPVRSDEPVAETGGSSPAAAQSQGQPNLTERAHRVTTKAEASAIFKEANNKINEMPEEKRPAAREYRDKLVGIMKERLAVV